MLETVIVKFALTFCEKNDKIIKANFTLAKGGKKWQRK